MYPRRSCLLPALLLFGCSLETSVTPPPPPPGDSGVDTAVGDGSADAATDAALDSMMDSSAMDSTTMIDGSPGDGGGDSTMLDGAMDATGDAAGDAGDADAGDAGDTGPADTGPMDTGPMDTGPVDTGPPDTGTIVTCDDAYSSSRSYFLCDMAVDRCEFYVDPSGDDSCDNICAAGGGTCLGRYDEAGDTGSSRCTRDETRGCSETSNDFICICTRPVI